MRYLVLAFVIVTGAMFTLVLKTPGRSIRSIFWQQAEVDSKQNAEKTADVAPPKAPSAPVSKRSKSTASTAGGRPTAGRFPVPNTVPAEVHTHLVVKISGEPTGLYAVNSSRGTPIEMLEKVGSSRVDLQACKLEYSIVSPK